MIDKHWASAADAVADISDRYSTIAASAAPNRSCSERFVTLRDRSPPATDCATTAFHADASI